MVTRVIRRWWPPGVVLVGAVFLLTVSRSVVSSVVAVLLLVYAWVLSPAFFPKGTDLQVALELPQRVVHRLSSGSLGAPTASGYGLARAVVSSANGGDHTTPTVIFRNETRTNPDAVWVRSLLS